MITVKLLSFFFSLIKTVASILLAITFDYSSLVYQDAISLIRGVLYMLPCGTIHAILLIAVAIYLFRLAIAFIQTLWRLIPFA